VADRVAGKQSLDDGEGLLEPVDALARAVERDTSSAVLGLVPAGADAELEAPARQMVQARRLVGEDRGMPEVVGEHKRAHPQARGHRGHGGQRAERGQLLAEGRGRKVVAYEERADPRVFNPARVIEPRLAIKDGLADNPESDLTRYVHTSCLQASAPRRSGDRTPCRITAAAAWH
jgi:hypothetical protein